MLSTTHLSVTQVDQSKTVKVRIMQFSPYSSPIPQTFVGKVSCWNSGGFPKWEHQTSVAWGKLFIFQLYASISLKRYKIRPKLLLMSN